MAESQVRIRVTTSGAEKLDRLNKSVNRLDTSFGKISKGITATVAKLGLLTTAAVGLANAFNTLKTQDFAIAKVKTLGVNAEELTKNLREVSKELKGQASVAELTGAAYDVASAGFNNAADAAKVLKAASLGATGGFADINTVANATTSVLNAYGLSADKASTLVDQFIQTQNDGKIVVAEYAANIGKVAAAAAGLGIPLAEVNAAIAQSTASGVQAEVAFTGLKSALARLASGEASKALKDFGIEITAASLESDGLVGTLEKLVNAGLDTGQIFKALGTEAAPALLPLINNLERTKELVENQKNSVGAAAKAQEQAAQTISGAIKRIETAFSNLVTSGQGITRVIIPAFNALATVIEALNGPLGVLVGVLGAVATAWFLAAKAAGAYAAAQAAAGGAAITGLITKLAALGGGLQTVVTGYTAGSVAIKSTTVAITAQTVAAGALKIALLAIPWVALAAGVTALGVATFKYYQEKKKLNDLTTGATQDINAYKDGIAKLKTELGAAEQKLIALQNAGNNNARAVAAQKKRVDELKRSLEAVEGEYLIKIRIQEIREKFGIDPNAAPGTRGRQGRVDEFKRNKALEALQNQPTPTGGGSAGGGDSSAADKAKSEAEQRARQLQTAKDLLRVSENQLKIDEAISDGTRRKLEAISQKSDIEARYTQLIKDAASEEEKTLLIAARKNELKSVQVNLERDLKALRDGALAGIKEEIAALEAKVAGKEKEYEIEKKIKELTDKGISRGEAEDLVGRLEGLKKEAAMVERLDQLYAQVGNTIADGIVAGITDAIEGGENLQKILSDTLKSVGKLLINAGVRSIGGGIGIPGFADGGIAPAGTPSLVGERGPELITPLTPVAVSPFTENGASLADQVGNAAGADAVDAFDAAAQSLGTQSATMMNNAAEARSDSMMQSEAKMNIETTVINSVEYATVDQVRKASSAAAKTARARVFSDLKNKPTARGGIGL